MLYTKLMQREQHVKAKYMLINTGVKRPRTPSSEEPAHSESRYVTIENSTSISRDMGSATKGALIVNRSVVPFQNLGSPTDQFKCLIVKYDLDFDLVTLQGH